MTRLVQLAAAVALACALAGAMAVVASAESDGPPAVLVLEGTVSELKVAGQEEVGATLSTLGGLELAATGGSLTLSNCLPLEGKEKDTNLCHEGILTIKGVKKLPATNCRSENEKGEKIPWKPS